MLGMMPATKLKLLCLLFGDAQRDLLQKFWLITMT
jgi:hypothetical protein